MKFGWVRVTDKGHLMAGIKKNILITFSVSSLILACPHMTWWEKCVNSESEDLGFSTNLLLSHGVASSNPPNLRNNHHQIRHFPKGFAGVMSLNIRINEVNRSCSTII